MYLPKITITKTINIRRHHIPLPPIVLDHSPVVLLLKKVQLISSCCTVLSIKQTQESYLNPVSTFVLSEKHIKTPS